MPVQVRSFAKLNIGLYIGARRASGFHELRTVYQTIALHDMLKVDAGRGVGIEIRCKNPQVPQDETNTCWRVAERVLKLLKARARIVIQIEKNLPVQGGLGAASSNAVATMLAMERALKQQLTPEQRWDIAAEVGSDLPLFLVGGTILGVGRGEEVFPLQDLLPTACVLVTPELGVSTPKAFADWDALFPPDGQVQPSPPELTAPATPSRINVFGRSVFEWLAGSLSGVPAQAGGDRAETPLLDLVRAGIENDFERVVFPEHPELREAKRVLERAGARYASLSGSGSALYGLFESAELANAAAEKVSGERLPAVATSTLTRAEYWAKMFE